MEHLTKRTAAAPIQELFNEFKKRAFSQDPEDRATFLERLLNCAAELFGAAGGVVWLFDADGMTAAARFRFQEIEQFESEDKRGRHRLFLASTAAQGQCRYLGPLEAAADLECENPTDYSVLLVPLAVGGGLAGALEFFWKDDVRLEKRSRLLADAAQVRAPTEECLLRFRLAEQDRSRREAQSLDAFTLLAHESLEVPQTAYTLANEIRNVIDCDRVGVAIWKRARCRIAALSGQDRFDSRANAVRLLEKLASLSGRTGESIICDEAVAEVAPEIKRAVYEYLEETHAKQFVAIPLKKRIATAAGDRFDVVGVVVAERLERATPMTTWLPRLERLAPHAASALANAVESEWPILAPVGRVFHRSRLRKLLGNVRISTTIFAAIALLTGWLAFYPVDFALQAPGKLQPALRREVFAEVEGTVHRVYVRHGQDVTRGTLLAELVNHDLNVAEAELVKQIQETSQEIANSERELNDSQRATALDRGKITARRATAQERLRGLRAQEAFYAEKRKRLRVVSPIDGRVATWNVSELLMMRPVQQGQILMTVVDPRGDWELEIRLPEQRLGHVLTAQQEIQADLPVTFLVAADPYRTYRAKLRDVRLAADVQDAEEGNTVLLKATLDQSNLPALTLGGEVRAKVDCGSRPVGYAWFHEIYEFFQLQVLFRF